MPGVEMVAPFGNTLHVSGTDRAALAASVAPFAKRAGRAGARSRPRASKTSSST